MPSTEATQVGDGHRGRIGRFFYDEEVPYGLALVRIFLPLVLLVVMLQRWAWTREIFSADGAPVQLSVGYGYGNMLPELPGGLAVALVTALCFFLVTSALGWFTRVSLIASTVLYVYFNLLDSASTLTKYSVIASHVMLILCFSRCGAVWSLDSLRRKRLLPGPPPRSSVWPRRLMQILIGVVYFGAAVTKLHTPAFFSGEQMMYWMITHINFDHPLGEYLTLFPALLAVFAYVTVVWEITFIFLCWRGLSRVIMLGMGAGFHIMTNLTLGLYIFPAVCLSIYLAFLGEDDVRRIRLWLRRRAALRRIAAGWAAVRTRVPALRLPRPSEFGIPPAAVFGFLAVLAAVAGVEIEYHMDRYGERRPEGPYALQPMDQQRAGTMVHSDKSIRDSDKIFALETGTMVVNGTLANRQRTFQPGETLIAQCSLTPPHEDMWLECHLLDERGQVLDRDGIVVPREMMRCNYRYFLDRSLEPGDYFLVLKTRGREIMRRRITLESGGRTAGVQSPVAN